MNNTKVDQSNVRFEDLIQELFEVSNENRSERVPHWDALSFDNVLISQSLVGKGFDQKVFLVPEHIVVITEKLGMLAKNIRLENHTVYFNLEKELHVALCKALPNKPEQWLARAFAELVKRVGADPSWSAMINIVNCVHLVAVVTNVYGEKHQINRKKLESLMHEILESFLNENFSEFIFQMGGWEDFLDYYEEISSKNTIEASPALWPAVLHAVFLTGLSAIVFYTFK